MWIQVRTMDGKVAHTVDSLSRLTKVEELRKKIQELFHVEPGLQRLFYRGKQVNSLCRLPACLPTTFVLALSRQGTHTLSPPYLTSLLGFSSLLRALFSGDLPLQTVLLLVTSVTSPV